MRYYYIHPESLSAFTTDEPPEIVLTDGLCMEVDRDEYLRACEEWEIDPDPLSLGEILLGDLL